MPLESLTTILKIENAALGHYMIQWMQSQLQKTILSIEMRLLGIRVGALFTKRQWHQSIDHLQITCKHYNFLST